jgi:hypothetical protein
MMLNYLLFWHLPLVQNLKALHPLGLSLSSKIPFGTWFTPTTPNTSSSHKGIPELSTHLSKN